MKTTRILFLFGTIHGLRIAVVYPILAAIDVVMGRCSSIGPEVRPDGSLVPDTLT